MSQTLYIHLGHGRCGSSSIQRFAADNRAKLSELGVAYPLPAEIGIDTPVRGHANAYPLYQLRREIPSPLALIPGFLERQEHPKILLSSESLLNADPLFMRQLVETARACGTNVVALAYVREQREWLISRYAQAIKSSKRWTVSLPEYLEQAYRTPRLNYCTVFARNAVVFGRENLVIRIFERPRLRNGDVRVDVFDVLGIDVQELIADDPRANASASIEELEVMRFINQRTEPKQFDSRRFLRDSQDYWRETGWEPSRDLYRLASPDLLRELGEYFSSPNEEFRKEFFPDEPAPLFSSKIPVHYQQLPEDERIDPRSFELLANHLVSVLGARHARPRARPVVVTGRPAPAAGEQAVGTAASEESAPPAAGKQAVATATKAKRARSAGDKKQAVATAAKGQRARRAAVDPAPARKKRPATPPK